MIALAVVLWAVVALALAFGLYVRYVEPARIEVTRTEVRLEGLPPALDGLTIGHLSDFHCQPDDAIEWSSREAVRLVMAEAPDLIAITGDMFEVSELAGECAWQLEGLSAPLGVWAVPGNHDRAQRDPYAYLEAPPERVEELREVLGALGVTLLVNESRTVEVEGAELAVAGVDDFAYGRDDAQAALAQVDGADVALLLAHTPDMLDDPCARRADLVLCGHTHGGQIRLPRIGTPWAPVWRDRRRGSGLLRADGTLCYVTRGVASATRARFRCRPEIALLTLRAGEETEALEVPVRAADELCRHFHEEETP